MERGAGSTSVRTTLYDAEVRGGRGGCHRVLRNKAPMSIARFAGGPRFGALGDVRGRAGTRATRATCRLCGALRAATVPRSR
eukprot:1821816-Prymnesium_polylepis.1